MTVHRFTPRDDAHDAVRAAQGLVEVLTLVDEAVVTNEGVAPVYRVRNLDNGREAFAFGDELNTE